MNTLDCSIHQIRIQIPDLSGFLDRVHEISSRSRTTIILFDADKMAGKAHVCSALTHAFRSWNSGSPISHRLEMEALLYASGSRQCTSGAQFGLHEGLNRAYLCVCPGRSAVMDELMPSLELSDSEDWESISEEKFSLLLNLFHITAEELSVAGHERIRDLVLERVALLEVYR